jgi:hypothetical protein
LINKKAFAGLCQKSNRLFFKMNEAQKTLQSSRNGSLKIEYFHETTTGQVTV